jgi:hypothetical protein
MTITTLKSELVGFLHGTTLNKISNISGVINRSARQLLLDIDPQETIRIAELTNPVMDDVFEYALPTDLKGTKIIDIRPQINRGTTDVFLHRYNQQFDLQKLNSNQDAFTVNFNAASKSIRINAHGLSSRIMINDAVSLTDNGTWTVDEVVATGLIADQINRKYGASSLKCNMSGGTEGYLVNSDMTAIDLSDHEDESTLLMWVYLPDASTFTSVTLYWGSSATAYWYYAATTRQDGTAFQDGWNLVSFPWASATQVLSPDSSAVDYCKILFTYDGTANAGVRVNSIMSNLGVIMEIEYYSKYLFRDASTGAFEETTTEDTDLINLDTETFNLFLYQIAIQVMQELQGVNAKGFDAPYFENKYREGIQKYKNQNKSQWQLPQSTYYTFKRRDF